MEHDLQPDPTTPEDNGPARPDFASLFPNIGSRMIVEQTYDMHVNYVQAHAARFGNVESASFKSWRENLPEYGADIDDDDTEYDELSELFDRLYDVAKLSNDPSQVLWVMETCADIASTARANLAGLHMGVKRSDVQAAATDDVAKMRNELDDFMEVCTKMANTTILDADAFWSIFPNRIATSKSGSTRTVYDGPKIPTTRKSSPLRANSSTLNLIVNGTEYDTGNLVENAKLHLRMDMADLRKAIGGEFTADNYGTDYIADVDGTPVVFSIVERKPTA